MLVRVADSLYWIGRYIERAEHLSRLAGVMLNAALDRTDAASRATRIAMAAVGGPKPARAGAAIRSARALVFDCEWGECVVDCLARARENARHVRDQITTETWERLNLLYLRATDGTVERAFAADAGAALSEVIADLHLFKGAADATMSHGEGWRFMLAGSYLERAQLMAGLLGAGFSDKGASATDDHIALMNLLRMACALEPYLRVYTADINAGFILQFLLFDEQFPRSIRFCTARIEEHLSQAADGASAGPRGGRSDARSDALRLAGRLNARLKYADVGALEATGAGPLLTAVGEDCEAIHAAIHEAFVAYPLEMGLPA
jgi:uncharacterized alpha-E superfamily protein